MKLRGKIKMLLTLLTSIASSACYNTTVTQFSQDIKMAKANSTFVKQYVCDTTLHSPIKVGDIWVEKTWFYGTLGNKEIYDTKNLYVRYEANAGFNIERYWEVYLIEIPNKGLTFFESYRGHKGNEDKVWYELAFKKNIHTLPDTIRFNIFYKKNADTSTIGELVLVSRL